jgi:MYXO-CTERM domain-containing protein
MGGYCFASGASEISGTGTSKGCAVSPGGGSTLAGLGWLSVGLLAFLQRRRSRKG